jgi:VIT1/CCC1 family predicted Fe2+/Mn2+ transporter
MIVLDVIALLLGIAGVALGIVGVATARSAKGQADRAHRESLEALGHSAAAADLSGRAHAEAADAVSRAVAAGRVAEQSQARAVEALTRANESVGIARSAREGNHTDPEVPDPDTDVTWECEQVRSGRWVIRNTGFATAAGALVTDASRPPKFITAEEVIPRDVPPGDNLQFRVAGTRDALPPRVRVTWGAPGVADRRSFELTLVV